MEVRSFLLFQVWEDSESHKHLRLHASISNLHTNP